VSLTSEFVRTLVRAVLIGTVTTLAAMPAKAFFEGCTGRARRAAWVLLLVPFFTPALLVGYSYSPVSLQLLQHPFWNEALYCALLVLRLVPIAVLVLYFHPTTLSPSALHCHELACADMGAPVRFLGRLGFQVTGSLHALAGAFAIVLLFSLSEFEMATLLGVRSWTVSLFDAQAGGMFLGESLKLAAVPIMVEAVVLGALLVMLVRTRRVSARSVHVRRAAGKAARAGGWAYLGVAAFLAGLLPVLLIAGGAMQGLEVLARNTGLAKDIGASVAFAAAAAAAAYLAAGYFSNRVASGMGSGVLAGGFAVSAPGLLGALLLSILILSLFQLPGLREAYDTPAPLALALTLLVLPYALVMRVLLHSLRPSRAVRVAEMAGMAARDGSGREARRLVREMRSRGRLLLLFLLFVWSYYDLTASAILSPSDMTPASVRLYNMMHYGQSAGLSIMVFAVFCVPFVILAAVWGARKLAFRREFDG
jgi:ABC-type Fe3+ transport system permease subunit